MGFMDMLMGGSRPMGMPEDPALAKIMQEQRMAEQQAAEQQAAHKFLRESQPGYAQQQQIQKAEQMNPMSMDAAKLVEDVTKGAALGPYKMSPEQIQAMIGPLMQSAQGQQGGLGNYHAITPKDAQGNRPTSVRSVAPPSEHMDPEALKKFLFQSLGLGQ